MSEPNGDERGIQAGQKHATEYYSPSGIRRIAYSICYNSACGVSKIKSCNDSNNR